jgi:uncharacterized protein YecT (DUF1311 family)
MRVRGGGGVIVAALLMLAAAQGPAEKAARADLAEFDPKEDCRNPQSQPAMNGCAALDAAKADDALNAQWAKTVAAMKDFDTDVAPGGDHLPTYYTTLLDGQRAWLKFRDSQCLSEGFAARGGTMEPMLEQQCKARLTRERTAQLKALADDGE